MVDELTLTFCGRVWVLSRSGGVHRTGPPSTRDIPGPVLSPIVGLGELEAGCCGSLAPWSAGSGSNGSWVRCDSCLTGPVAQATAYVQAVDLCALHCPQGLIRSHLTLRRRHSTQDKAGRRRFLMGSVGPAIDAVAEQRQRSVRFIRSGID